MDHVWLDPPARRTREFIYFNVSSLYSDIRPSGNAYHAPRKGCLGSESNNAISADFCQVQLNLVCHPLFQTNQRSADLSMQSLKPSPPTLGLEFIGSHVSRYSLCFRLSVDLFCVV